MPKEFLTFHFDQPEDEPPLPVASRVIAPIQKRPTIGYIVGETSKKPDFETVSISQVIDFWPLFSPELIKLGFWLASSCLCSPGEAFNAMLPSGIKQRIVRNVRPTASAFELRKNGKELPNALQWLFDNFPVPLSVFLKTFPKLSRKLNSMLNEGLIEILHERPKEAGPKIQTKVGIVPGKKLELERLTPKEKLVVEFILKMNCPLSPSQIRREIRVSSAPIDQLLRKGILEKHEERIFREVATEAYYSAEPDNPPILTADQEKALAAIRESYKSDRKPVLIRGVTCSGKTEIYLRWGAEQLEAGKGVIVLVPEISLTPQIVKRFRDRFGKSVAILHSRLSEGERFDQWELIRRGECRIVVGARSAVFAPVKNLGSIIIDEEGEPTFKQADIPKYHARNVAEKRCELEGGILVMGSATPTIEAYQRGLTGKYKLVELLKRVKNRLPPKVVIVDMRRELSVMNNRSTFSFTLQKAVETTLAAKQQIILYLNRRGYSSFVFCRNCGFTMECSKCSVSLVYHLGSDILRCHYCGEAKTSPRICPACQSEAIKYFGAGTQRIEAEAKRYFPGARIRRMDSDTVSPSGTLEEILDSFGKGEIDILIGTQMVAKGLDFPGVTLVGIMAADGLLRLPDFRASERNFSLLAQVSGRTGRGDQEGTVVLQTYNPDHYSIRFAVSEDYAGFFTEEVKHRSGSGFPPFSHIAVIVLASEKIEKAKEAGKSLADKIKNSEVFSEDEILGPAPAPIEKMNNLYRFQILVKFRDLVQSTSELKRILGNFHFAGTKVSADIDPFFPL